MKIAAFVAYKRKCSRQSKNGEVATDEEGVGTAKSRCGQTETADSMHVVTRSNGESRERRADRLNDVAAIEERDGKIS